MKPAAGRIFFKGENMFVSNNSKSKKSFLEAPLQDETLWQDIWQLFKSYWKNGVGMIKSLPQAGTFFEETMSSGNNSKSKKSFLEAPHQDETLRQNIWHLFKGTWKNFVGMI